MNAAAHHETLLLTAEVPEGHGRWHTLWNAIKTSAGVAPDTAMKRRFLYLVAFVAPCMANAFLMHSKWQGSINLHTLLEFAAALLAFATGGIALQYFRATNDKTFRLIGGGLVANGCLSGYHALISTSMLSRFFPSPLASLAIGSEFISSLFLSAMLLLIWASRHEESGAYMPEFITYVMVILWILVAFTPLFFVLVPLSMTDASTVHRIVPAVVCLAALIAYLRSGRWMRNLFEHWLVLATVVCFSEGVLLAASARLHDAMFVTAHIMKIFAFGCMLLGLISAVYGRASERESGADETQPLAFAEADNGFGQPAAVAAFCRSVEVRYPLGAAQQYDL